jgi:putative acetyltransferase
MSAVVRAETPGDEDAVREVNEAAFGRREEARLVDVLRAAPTTRSLVAIVDERIVGNIVFSPVRVEGSAATIQIAGLAPMAVVPGRQRIGIGGLLIRAGLADCRRFGYQAVVVVGHPQYYPRFGFVPAHTKGLSFPGPVPLEAFMVLELETGVLEGLGGVVRYAPEFDAFS